MNLKKSLIFIWIVILAVTLKSFSQGSNIYEDGLKIKINDSGSNYIRFILVNQIWMRYVENNPGTFENGIEEEYSSDIALRRSRLIMYSQISPRFLVLTHLGINNQTFRSGGDPGFAANNASKKPQLFLHDVYTEYSIFPVKDIETGEQRLFNMSMGAGIHYWNGVSRLSSGSILNMLTLDLPLFNYPNLEHKDQFGRQMGIYAKGKLGKLDYRFHLNKPFSYYEKVGIDTVAPIKTNNFSTGGYVNYQFLGQESNVLPYYCSTYLGTKNIFNIGVGFYNHPKSMGQINAEKLLVENDIKALGLDIFIDKPIGKGYALSFYSVFYNYNYGKNYLRNIGILNVADSQAPESYSGKKADSGPGNAKPFIGTGNIFYTQAGILLPEKINMKGKIQPFAAWSYKDLEALTEPGHYFDLGLNYFIEGHHAKITAQYSSRPIYFDKKVDDRAGEWTLQAQIYL